jgi:hypothetical protein
MPKHLLAIAVILTVATGCDNVAWGGIDVELKRPPVSETAEAVVDSVIDTGPVNIDGPLLLAGVRDGQRAAFALVGEVLSDGVHSFPAAEFPGDTARLARMTAVGSEWILFSEGVRVGRVTVDRVAPASAFCGTRQELSGVVELAPAASEATRFLALPAVDARERPFGEFRQPDQTFQQRVASLNIGGDLLRGVGATWPADTLRYARHDIQSFRIGADRPFFAATFMYQDALEIRRPRQGAYALFFIAEEQGGAYREEFNWYRSVATEGKGAPRYFDHLDLDDDGSDEILLDVYGSERRWFAVLSRTDGSWRRTFQDPCGSGSSAN